MIHAATSKATPVDADELGLVDSAASNVLKKLTWANLKATLLAYFQGLFREKLTAARTYYVRTDGSDSNNGLVDSSGGAFLTIQKAIDTVATLDLSIYGATIDVADATWNENLVLKPLVGSAGVTILGNSGTPGSCVIAPTAGSCVAAGNGMLQEYTLDGFRYNAGTSGFDIVSGYGTIRLKNFTLGAVPAGFAQIYASNRAVIIASSTSYTIAGGGGYHFQAANGGSITANASTVTVTGTPAFSSAFASAANGSMLICASTTFSGSATGKRYDVTMNALIQTAGAGATFFPGNASGTTATGGEYA
ncbi:hypothetical protein [Acidovorax sp. ACV01]|uniref:hypothetical protein n=1 Tax=Acidovorax sp. ACV01 TaxID=2769311 RepID=UPI00177E4759|nr:hypothetical protein [Acidovorax sp. ACV01]MBD9395132.1 hypothetical protein [Acidovorax sp. ACV01]